MVFGVLLSGYVMTKYRPGARKVSSFVAVTKYIYAFGILLVMLANCGFENDLPGTLTADGSLSLDRGCNDGCHCNTEIFAPVCLSDPNGNRSTYFSACHAGCSRVSSTRNSTNYSECNCASNGKVESGFCWQTCSQVFVYIGLLATIKFIVSLSAVGNLIIDLRCVEERDKALSLGLVSSVSGLFGFLPTPLLFGTIIDSACLVWEESCGETGSCWVYSNDQFRYRLHGLTSACLSIAGVFEIITYFKVETLQLFDA